MSHVAIVVSNMAHPALPDPRHLHLKSNASSSLGPGWALSSLLNLASSALNLALSDLVNHTFFLAGALDLLEVLGVSCFALIYS